VKSSNLAIFCAQRNSILAVEIITMADQNVDFLSKIVIDKEVIALCTTQSLNVIHVSGNSNHLLRTRIPSRQEQNKFMLELPFDADVSTNINSLCINERASKSLAVSVMLRGGKSQKMARSIWSLLQAEELAHRSLVAKIYANIVRRLLSIRHTPLT
jgi:hypothetical protein